MARALINYFKIDEYPWETGSHFVIKMTDDFYSFFMERELDRNNCCFSFQHIFFRLFGLMPYDFFKFISSEYGAVLIPKHNSYVHFYFQTKKEAENFIHDANARMRFLVDSNKKEGD